MLGAVGNERQEPWPDSLLLVSVALGVMALLRGHWEFVPKPFSPLVALEPLPALSLGLPQWYSSVIPLPLVFSGVSCPVPSPQGAPQDSLMQLLGNPNQH